MARTVLVTGGTGFLGSNMVRALVARGDKVRVLRRPSSSLLALDGLELEHVLGDLDKPEVLDKAIKGCDQVYHVAAISSYWRSSAAQVYRVNIGGTRAVMQACLRAQVPRVVHTSSLAAIGIPPKGTLGDERLCFDPLSMSFPYAHSKHLAELEVQRAVAAGLPAVIVNPATVIGAGDHYMVSGSILIEIARGRMPAIPSGGMSMVDVDAVVQGHLAAAERGRVGERYILGGENLSHRQIAEIVGAIVGRRPPRLSVPDALLPIVGFAVDAFNSISPFPPMASGDQIRIGGTSFFFSSSKAVQELGFPIMPFQQAAEKAYRWYREHNYI